MPPLTTPRLVLRELTAADAPFVLELLNDPGFLRHIGDRGVRTLADAVHYIDSGPRASYARHGHGLLAVERRSDRELLGICGLLRRDELEAPDLGFALLARHAGQGYAGEAARAVLADHRARASKADGTCDVLAIANPDNARSIRLLDELEFRYEGQRSLAGSAEPLALFRWDPLDPLPPSATGDTAVEGDYTCPHCGERIVVPLDLAAGTAQQYVEDCPVCCSPNIVSVEVDEAGECRVSAAAE